MEEHYAWLREKSEQMLMLGEKAPTPTSASGFCQAAALFAVAAEIRGIGIDGIPQQ